MYPKRSIIKDKKGAIVSTEFALLLPIMVVLWAGIVEFTNMQNASRKTNLVAQSIADVIAGSQAVDDQSLNNMLRAGALIMAPYRANNLTIGIQSIEADGDGNLTVGWTFGNPGDPPAIAAGLARPNFSTIHVVANYTYVPVLGGLIVGLLPEANIPNALVMTEEAFAKPRLTTIIPRN